MTESSAAYTVTAGPAGSRDERFTVTACLPVETVRRIDATLDAFNRGLCPDDPLRLTRDALIDRAVQLWLAVREVGDEPVDGEDWAWVDGYFRSGRTA